MGHRMAHINTYVLLDGHKKLFISMGLMAQDKYFKVKFFICVYVRFVVVHFINVL